MTQQSIKMAIHYFILAGGLHGRLLFHCLLLEFHLAELLKSL